MGDENEGEDEARELHLASSMNVKDENEDADEAWAPQVLSVWTELW